MVLDKRQQAVLYDQCREALGHEGADLLMQELPPTGWDDIATKQDLAMLEQKLIGVLHQELRAQVKTYITWTGVVTATLVAVFATVTVLAAR